jgi:release factor glutamine methyltransferase
MASGATEPPREEPSRGADPAGPTEPAVPSTVGQTIGDLMAAGIAGLLATGAERPRLDAELLLGWAGGLERTTIVAHPERRVEPGAVARWEAAIKRRELGEPVAYIRGAREFFGLAFRVDARALIPRPETERLVELALTAAEERLAASSGAADREPLRIVDVGTGTGAVAVAVAKTLRDRGLLDRVAFVATDVSAEALALALINLEAHGLEADVRLVEADLLPAGDPPFDLVLANLPYIPSGDLAGLPVSASFEPAAALDGGSDGLAIIRRLIGRLPEAIRPGGAALLEIGADQAEDVGRAIEAVLAGWSWRVEPDLAGLPRVAVIDRPGAAPAGLAPEGSASQGQGRHGPVTDGASPRGAARRTPA